MSEKIKVTNAPMQIWLQVGEVDETVDFGDLCLEEVAWEQEPIGATDIAYVRADAFPYMQVFTDLTTDHLIDVNKLITNETCRTFQ
jgi:hypothetical protein